MLLLLGYKMPYFCCSCPLNISKSVVSPGRSVSCFGNMEVIAGEKHYFFFSHLQNDLKIYFGTQTLFEISSRVCTDSSGA